MKIYPLEKLSKCLDNNDDNTIYEEVKLEKIKFYKSFFGGYYEIESELIGYTDVLYMEKEGNLKGDFAFKLPDDIVVTGIPFDAILIVNKASDIDIDNIGVFKINDKFIVGKKKIKNNKLMLHINHSSSDIELDKVDYIECAEIIKYMVEF